jgi:peroxiredoxin
MSNTPDPNILPTDLPIPTDDGACAHLPGLTLPLVSLPSTAGRLVDLASMPGQLVIYCYPRTGRPGEALPTGWDSIPGARGCTPEACAFRDHYAELQRLDTAVFGLSTQDTTYQREVVERLDLPFELLSDEQLAFATALGLPTFAVDGWTLIRRLTLIVIDGMIRHVFYPVFPPDRHAAEVVAWLADHRAATG